MTIYSVQNQFGKKIEEIWNNPEYNSLQIKERGYAIQNELETNVLLFVGINPSYNNQPGKIFYNNDHSEIHPYFKKFKDISEKVGVGWAHIDLLFVRETNQKVVKEIESKKLGKKFINEQLDISLTIIENVLPKIIVVNNTYARELLKGRLDNDFNMNLGTPKFTTPNSLKGTPIFFTSMLTGQRALDLGSYERLIWQIKYVLKKNRTPGDETKRVES